jgi:hypothetical protein
MPSAQFYSIKDNRYKVVTGQIDGSNPPLNDTVGRLFICTTGGGGYTLNYLYYDNGISWIEIVPFNELFINVSLDLLGGTVEFTGHRLYGWNTGTVSWNLLNSDTSNGGDVVGPNSSTDNAVSRFDGTTGKLIQDSNVIINDSGDIETTGTITSGLVNGRDISSDGSTLDSHTSDGTIHYVQTAIDHTVISNIGTNSHVAIDSHIANISGNPHSVTKVNIGLGNVTDNAQLKRSSGDFGVFTLKLLPVSGDVALIEDSEDSSNKKYITLGSISHTILTNIGVKSHTAIDTHIDDSTIHYAQTLIDHTNLLNKGTNTHSAIDSHISSNSNPHSVTKTQIGLENVTNDSQLKRSANDFSSFTIKASLVSGDIILIEDSVDSNNKKYSTIGGISHTILSNIGTNSHVAIDSHISDGTLHYTQSNIDHTSIQNIGTNSHASIDTHISSISNPHSVTKTQVSLGNVTNDAQLKRSAGDFNSFTLKSIPISTDIVLIEDSADSNNKKKVTVSSLTGGGGGDVVGPASSTDNAIVRFDSTTGKLIQDSNVTINDTGDTNYGNHAVTNAKTVTFNGVGLVTPSGGIITCEFDLYQKIIANLGDQSSLTIQLNEPIGVGNFILILKQGSTTPTTSITWATEGTHAIYGSLTYGTTANDRTLIGLFYDGTDWYVSSSDMPQILAS